MSRLLYALLTWLALPFAAAAFIWRGWRNRACSGSLRQRLGWGLERRADRPLWLHAASVGEVRALAALLRTLPAEGPPLLVTVGTPTGLARARELFADLPAADAHGRAPLTVQAAVWDLPGATRRFLDATKPRTGVFIETELWPALIDAAKQAGVPLALVSARLSRRSLERYRRFAPSLMRNTVRAFAAIGAQSAADRERFIALGADPHAVTVTGNLKYDLPLDEAAARRGAALRHRFAAGRPLWVAGSTHPGEESDCLAAQRSLLQHPPPAGFNSPLLALAPRRPERFDAVARWIAAQGLRLARSSSADPDANVDVVLVDQMGVLGDWYAAADVTFVGGSLVPVGGHNLLEPAALARPVLAGPHGFNAPEVMAQLAESGGLQIVRDSRELAAAVTALLQQPSLARERGALAAGVVTANRGAAARARALVDALPGSLTAPGQGPAAEPASG